MLPIGIAVVVGLFLVQRFGTHRVGKFFGPAMLLWFLVLAATGLPEIARHPGVLRALSPSYIVSFVADHPYLAFISLSAVVLAITGAEALYADMGHFGRKPIRRAWFLLAFPCLTLNYLGQGALVLHDKAAITSPFFLLGPHWARIPLVVLATLATVIASQAVISGAYSVSRQAMRLGFLPHLTIRQTSTRESGQIYVPAVNWLLFGGVLILMVTFRSSNRLAAAYGLADVGVFVTTTSLFLVVAAMIWKWPRWRVLAFGVVFGSDRAGLPVGQPHQDPGRRLAAAEHRDRPRRRDDDLAGRATHRHRPAQRAGRPAAGLRRRVARARPAPRARHGGVPASDQGDDATRPARQRRVQPRAARARGGHVGTSAERAARAGRGTARRRRVASTATTASCTSRSGSASRTSRTSRAPFGARPG